MSEPRFGEVWRDPEDGEIVMVICDMLTETVVMVMEPVTDHSVLGFVTDRSNIERWERLA